MTYKRPKNSFLIHLLMLFVFSFMLIGCNAKKVVTSSETINELDKTPKIIFLNYLIKKNSDGKKTIDFINAKKVDGTLKNQKRKINSYGNFDDLVCSQFDASSTTLSQQLIKNPLSKHLEYVDETKNFKIAKMELDSAAFTVRLQLYPETKYIAINYSNDKHPLILTKVSEL
ncbi:hypothetical protein [Hyunsoonleella pacifica]|uniref:Uncharacterized protein n=1 Tax=Hyunsoonleella pacifica TaxID=1080224 RepID=A0A4Q9FMB0_9FLAO|nr:hypothetical protein [Hyunsoonleella pacifica]TBN12445.1 hypothetical protein EYD46_17150 [Hyunsoonleella pacifica]